MLFMKGKASSSHGSCHIVSHLSKYRIGAALPKPGPSAFKLARRFDRSQRIASEFRPLHKTEKRQKNVTLSLVQGRGTSVGNEGNELSFAQQSGEENQNIEMSRHVRKHSTE